MNTPFRFLAAALAAGALLVPPSTAAPSAVALPAPDGAQARRLIVYTTPSAPPSPAPGEVGRG